MARSAQSRKERSGRQPVHVSTALSNLVKSLSIQKTLSGFTVITSWESIVGEQIAKVATPQRMENGVLFVSVTTAPWRAELSMKRLEIIDRINAALGEHAVKDIRFR
jgi:predicted nucleic acid-binding Zn ribbon protein